MTFRRLSDRFRGQADAIMFLKFFTHLPERMIRPKIRDHPLQRRGYPPGNAPPHWRKKAVAGTNLGETAVRLLQSVRRYCANRVFLTHRTPTRCLSALIGGGCFMLLCPAGQRIVSQLAQGFDYLPFCFIGAFQVVTVGFHNR